MNNKVIWITGASSGIGEALAYQLNELGSKIILSARREDMLLKVQNNCKFQKNAAILPLDLTKFDSLESITSKAISVFGKIDILINNGGLSQRSLIIDTNFEVYRQMIDINYLGTIKLTKHVLPYFIAQKSGHFVTVTSLMGKFSSPYRSGYCGAKHALHGFFDTLRMEHEKDNINVSIICPGFIQTNVAKNALTGDGSALQKEDNATENGMPVNKCAKKIITAIKKNRFETYIGGKEIFGIYLKRFFPKLLHKVVMKSKVR
ncbi:SDR family oxidoreductase [Maribacter hydrothermalis]|uniref:Short-chain dehydrogenase n=1 Tax=Maribacter hydrothermalis TaxID=1836467 RepID=A0A1B7ZCR3_9FLAO|nr:SDR family oxidoreductase [Maribacter hydrothermalis]APQ18545.1 short chain dehydrogenase [Maribacter hydrothermalis]OBR40900.1 short-chain dehydrogenase [Maribacter hydrothermalis]